MFRQPQQPAVELQVPQQSRCSPEHAISGEVTFGQDSQEMHQIFDARRSFLQVTAFQLLTKRVAFSKLLVENALCPPTDQKIYFT